MPRASSFWNEVIFRSRPVADPLGVRLTDAMQTYRHQVFLGIAAALALTAMVPRVAAQAVVNPETDVSVEHPAYRAGTGPVVAIDEGHNNYHTLEGRYAPFGAVLKNDGFRVVSSGGRFEPSVLAGMNVLVISNPLASSNVDTWKLPTPSAFDSAEIEAVRTWVQGGGALFLIADHMPFAGAASDLAGVFGFAFDNAYAVKGDGLTAEIFSQDAKTLADNAVTRGLGRGPAVTEVQTFMGSSFRAPAAALPIMTLDEGWALLYPEVAGKFDAAVRRRPATRLDLRGAALSYGNGRVVVVSEAALFTNQLVKGAPYGFGQPSAKQDKQLLINIVEWLGRTPRSP